MTSQELASTTSWLEDVAGAGLLYSPSLLTTSASSLVICLACCSNIVKCKAASYNNGTGVCTCFDGTQSMVTRHGNRLWNRQFDGFTYIAQLDWLILLITDTKRKNADAESFCGTMGARLAVLDTDEKLNYLIGLHDFPDDTSIYVGATDKQTEGLYLWSTGANLTTNWLPGEPNSFRVEEDCVVVLNTGFNDFPCEEKANFVCELG
ncbi:mannose-binding protein-like [Mizuhopecten yessoensis]|uniref:mannose-binding protein-like n=1 Tax=Mizuhopecten yessoensis TaxID=6573 RepID=UPI000B45D49E|nr:mannose-binding protein-like [Mizuhopecten yessoensis]